MQYFEHIRKLFPQLEDELLTSILEHSSFQHIKAGQVLMKRGEYIRNTVLVLEGTVKVYREDNEGHEFFMYYLRPGQACAISMICAMKSEVSQVMAIVEEDAELLTIPLDMMEKWMARYRSWYVFVVETYRERFEEVLTLIDQVAFRNMDERLEFYLKRNFNTNSRSVIDISHQQIANDLSTSREVISRLLKKMEQRGLVKLHRNSIQLLVSV